jgi:putative acetyltransferase
VPEAPEPQEIKPVLLVQRETPDQPEVVAFLTKADERSTSLYPAESRHGLAVAALLSASVRFFVARQDGLALGCGGYMLLPERGAEMKRLFVDPAARGWGVGSAIVTELERAAAGEGVGTLFLETGVKSSEALHLYKRLGFVECEPFSSYRPDPLSVFMQKRLA